MYYFLCKLITDLHNSIHVITGLNHMHKSSVRVRQKFLVRSFPNVGTCGRKGRGGQKLAKSCGRLLWMAPNSLFPNRDGSSIHLIKMMATGRFNSGKRLP